MEYKILIADDDQESVEKVEEILQAESGSFLLIKASKKEIYKKSLEHQPDILLVNQATLVKEGIESIMSLKQNKVLQDIPVLLITDYTPRTNFDRVFEFGIVDFIRKPFERDDLLMRLEAAESRREFQHAIYKEHELLRELSIVAKKTATGVLIINAEGWIEWVNDGFEKMYGYTFDEFREKYEKTLFDKEKNPKLFNAINTCKEKRLESISYECKWKTKFGEYKWIQTSLTPVFNEQNEIIKYIAIESDVSELKEAEERLEAKNENLLTLTENLESTNLLLDNQRKEIEKQKEFIEDQKKKSEELLLNILPFETAEQLKKKGFARSKQYKLVTILFTDFKDFSHLTNTMDSQELIKELNLYIQQFDEIIEDHFIEKIKTIGDAYMCAGGLPLRNKSNPIDVTLAGLKIQKFMNDFREKKLKNNEQPWELRLGIHTGEVIAGVIGKKKFAYDIWGDAVNKASRMEQSGEVGKVNVSGDTYQYIQNYFDCTYRGKIQVKNEVELEMYFVNRLKPEYSEDPDGTIPNAEFRKILAKY
ncbi:MAG: adenylate/guanylate cyclase domain-containing protein [Bacteroidales bacterium]|jgi:PAS domain S-box-containing protein|nr:adenylate/guanylate cyclase domain-containing protein [Bacteroidales bacterium]